ncbi:cyclin-like protein [Fimicolochytrium jonesii]|uniref:cyclin-like protein n=1 Tax=Fimicolochytrium jonesii TaxID=1396493 RepID=UPI0022FED776|nr:cyclin-like protein [Fimicolochytrium jonesii]KAI8816291.1 cyclin-like protein [Fimicolochytrium jonesii]
MSTHSAPRSATVNNHRDGTSPPSHPGVTTRGQEKRAAAAAEEQRRQRHRREAMLMPADRAMPKFVLLGGRMLELENPTIATALVYWHRYARYIDVHHPEALAEIDPHLIAAAALSLAAKQCEDPVKLRDVVNVCYWLVKTDESDNPYLDISERYFELKDSLIDAELVLIRVLDFDGNGRRSDGRDPHPRQPQSSHANSINNRHRAAPLPAPPTTSSPPPPNPHQTHATLTITLLLDTHLSPTLALLTNPRHLAIACTYLAGRACGVHVALADADRVVGAVSNGMLRWNWSEKDGRGESVDEVVGDVVAFLRGWEEGGK